MENHCYAYTALNDESYGENTTPRGITKRKPPKSLPDLDRAKARSKVEAEQNQAAMFLTASVHDLTAIVTETSEFDGVEEFGLEKTRPSFTTFWGKGFDKVSFIDDILANPGHVVREIMNFQLPIVISTLTQNDQHELIGHLNTGIKFGLVKVITACVEKLAMFDAVSIRKLHVNLPESVLLAVYDLKLRNTCRPTEMPEGHEIVMTKQDVFCPKCGPTKMIECKKCASMWCTSVECRRRYERRNEPVCFAQRFCKSCKKPTLFHVWNSSFCSCSESSDPELINNVIKNL